MGIKDLLKNHHNEILAIAKHHGAYDVRVFGSVARGEATEESDIDFVVKVEEKTSPWFPAGFIIELEELLNKKVDVITEGALHWHIKDRILKEAVPL